MENIQREILLKPKPRGFHLITNEIIKKVPEISHVEIGIAFINILHTSASVCLNENADPEVREDLESFFNKLVPDGSPYFSHNYEGNDDMPAHLKSVLCGTSITVPISNGRLNLGTWQGIYLGEHRDKGGRRRLIITILG